MRGVDHKVVEEGTKVHILLTDGLSDAAICASMAGLLTLKAYTLLSKRSLASFHVQVLFQTH